MRSPDELDGPVEPLEVVDNVEVHVALDGHRHQRLHRLRHPSRRQRQQVVESGVENLNLKKSRWSRVFFGSTKLWTSLPIAFGKFIA